MPDRTQRTARARTSSGRAPQGSQAAEPNLLLRAIPAKEYAQLIPQLEAVTLVSEQVLYEANEPISAVYFLGTGVASMVSIMRDGATVEVSTVGNEGLIGVPLLLGALSMPVRCFLQVPGDGKRSFMAAPTAQSSALAPSGSAAAAPAPSGLPSGSTYNVTLSPTPSSSAARAGS